MQQVNLTTIDITLRNTPFPPINVPTPRVSSPNGKGIHRRYVTLASSLLAILRQHLSGIKFDTEPTSSDFEHKNAKSMRFD